MAYSHPVVASDAADSIYRCIERLNAGNNTLVQLINLRHHLDELQTVADWAQKTGTSSYKGQAKVRTQLINAAATLRIYIEQLNQLILRLEADPTDQDAQMKIMILRTAIKAINYAPPLDMKVVINAPVDQTTAKLVKELGHIEVPEQMTPSMIFGKSSSHQLTDPLSDEE